MYQILVPDPFFILVNNPKQPFHARNCFKNKIFFLLSPVPFNGQIYKKQKGPRTSDQSLFRLQVIPKLTSVNLCKPIHDIKIIPLPFVLLNLESVETKRKNYKNLNISRTKKSFLNEIKNNFYSF